GVKVKRGVGEVWTGGRAGGGAEKAPVTIIAFSDYQCPYCKRAHATVEQVMKTYGDKVKLVYRDYPLPFHENARPAALAAACANAQGKFWEFHQKLWGASDLSTANLKAMAGEVGLDQKKFDECLDKQEFKAVIEKDIADGAAVGVTGTPAFFINGRMLSGAQPFEKFKQVIDEELARSWKSRGDARHRAARRARRRLGRLGAVGASAGTRAPVVHAAGRRSLDLPRTVQRLRLPVLGGADAPHAQGRGLPRA